MIFMELTLNYAAISLCVSSTTNRRCFFLHFMLYLRIIKHHSLAYIRQQQIILLTTLLDIALAFVSPVHFNDGQRRYHNYRMPFDFHPTGIERERREGVILENDSQGRTKFIRVPCDIESPR